MPPKQSKRGASKRTAAATSEIPETPNSKRTKTGVLPCCSRCLPYMVDENETDACNGILQGSQKTKCARCVRTRHGCVEVDDENVKAHVWRWLRARDERNRFQMDAVQEEDEDDDDFAARQQVRQDRLAAARTALANEADASKKALRAWQRNANKMTGGKWTGSKGGARASRASGLVDPEVTSQLMDISSSLRGLVEIGRQNLASRPGASLEKVDEAMGLFDDYGEDEEGEGDGDAE